jgi:hypothetical protein
MLTAPCKLTKHTQHWPHRVGQMKHPPVVQSDGTHVLDRAVFAEHECTLHADTKTCGTRVLR